jgi:ABC-2 type transport system permease protein
MFSLSRVSSVCLKEFRHIRRDPRILFLVVLSPAIMLVAFGYLFSFEISRVRLAVLDLDRSPTSRQYVASLLSDGEIRLAATPGSYEEIDQLLLRGLVDVALVVPESLEADLLAGGRVPVQLIVDGSDPLAGRQNGAAVAERSASFSMNLQVQRRAVSQAPVEIRGQVLYNPELKSVFSMVPALMAIVLIVPALAIVISITREKETGSFEGLASTPVQGAEYLLGKLIAYTAFSLVSALVAFLVAVGWFKVPFAGDPALYLLLTVDYLVATMGFAMLVATLVKSQQAAMLIVLLIYFVPSFFLTGLIVPVDPESARAQFTALVLPATHFVTISRGLFLKGVELADLVTPAVSLAGMGFAAVALSIAFFRKEAA